MLATHSTRLPQYGMLQALLRSQAHPLRASTRSLRALPIARPSNGQSTAIVACPRGQVRYATSSHKRPAPNQESFAQTMRRAMRLTSIFRGQSLRKLYRQSPGETSLAVVVLAVLTGVIGYTVYLYFNYFYSPYFTRYPPEVAKSMRRALYYSNEKLDPKLALKYYKLAIEQCHTHGLDPFSDEVTGIKIQLAAWLEKIENIKGSIQVLDLVLTENKKWLRVFETAPETLPRAPLPGSVVKEGESERTITQEEFDDWLWSSRNRILAKSCGISTKLGELYAHDQVLANDESHEALMWAVETSLKEFRRRAAEGVKENEGRWMTPEEIGGALESLAHSYERKEQFDLALPLFFQALRLCQDQCHLAVIMNNVSISFAQHPPRAPYETLAAIIPGEEGPSPATTSSSQTWTRKELLESAQRWAKNALAHAKQPTGEQRTPECDQACAVACINLGDIAAMAGEHTEARKRYEQGIKISKENGFTDGVQQAQDGLRRLP